MKGSSVAMFLCFVLLIAYIQATCSKERDPNSNIAGPFECAIGKLLTFNAVVTPMLGIEAYTINDKGQRISYINLAFSQNKTTVHGFERSLIGYSQRPMKTNRAKRVTIYIGCRKDGFDVYTNEPDANGNKYTHWTVEHPRNEIFPDPAYFYVVGTEDVAVRSYDTFITNHVLPFARPIKTTKVPHSQRGAIHLILFVKGTSSGRFVISLYENHDIGFHMSVRFKDSKVVFNKHYLGRWMDETIVKEGAFPFKETPNIYRLTFVFNGDNIEVGINGHSFVTYGVQMTRQFDRIVIEEGNARHQMEQPVVVMGLRQDIESA